MAQWVFRALFILASAGTAYSIGYNAGHPFAGLLIGILISLGVIVADWFLSTGPIALVSSVVFGVLLGLLFATLTVQVVALIVSAETMVELRPDLTAALIVIYSYLGITFIYQSRDRFNLVVPYVEFRREEKGRQPVVLDTSVIIDGRLPEVLRTNAIDGPFLVPELVLSELQKIADSSEKPRRERGRLGLEVLNEIRDDPDIDLRVQDLAADQELPVDAQLIRIAKMLGAKLMTGDFNLNRTASLEGIPVINLNKLANALKPIALPGERIEVKLVRPGEQEGQAVGYLPDGTLVIVENAVHLIGERMPVVVRNTITRESGRMIFADAQD